MVRRKQTVTVVDYGMGNIRSLCAAVIALGYEPYVTGNPSVISAASTIVLPGVGSFPAAMDAVRENGIDTALSEAIRSGRSKILGICLGMQLLTQASDEDGGDNGLAILGGRVSRFSPHEGFPVPHIGFNRVQPTRLSALFSGFEDGADFYFVHSYRVREVDVEGVVATCNYGQDFAAAFEAGNVYGTQFHPEKSQTNGLRLLANFLDTALR